MAQADVQQLLLQIDASTELARRELRKLDGDFDKFTKSSERAAGSAGGAFDSFGGAAAAAKATVIGFAAGLGIEAVIGFGRSILQAADDLGTAADQAQIGVERFQTLREGLRALEIDSEGVDQIFKKLVDTLGAVQGDTAAAGVEAALDKMGIKSRILNGEIATSDELFDAIAASAKSFGSQAEFTAAVVDIVGRKVGVDLAAALADGGVALAEQEQAFRDSGAVIKEDYIKTLADANEKVDAFVARSKNGFIIWAAGFLEAAGQIKRAGESLSALDFLISPVAAYSKFAANFGDERRSDQLARDFPISDFLAPVKKAERETFVRPPKTTKGGRTPKTAAAKANPRDQLQALQGNSLGDFDEMAQFLNNPTAFLNPTKAAEKLSTTLQGAFDSSKLDALVQALPDLNAELEQASLLGSYFLDDLTGGLANAITQGGNLGDVLVDSLARAAEAMIQSGLLNLLSGGKQGISFGDSLAGVGKLFGGFFADGGRPPRGKISMVGERGPELFVPDGAGTIIPNHKLGQGGTTNIVNDLRGAIVQEDLYRRIEEGNRRAAAAGAQGGAQMAAAQNARTRRRSL